MVTTITQGFWNICVVERRKKLIIQPIVIRNQTLTWLRGTGNFIGIEFN